MKKVLLWGNSIFLAGLAAALRAAVDLEVLCASGAAARGFAPDVLIVDLNDEHCGDALALLRARPDLRVVGVNAATNAVTVLQGQVFPAQSVEEVTHTILDFDCGF